MQSEDKKFLTKYETKQNIESIYISLLEKANEITSVIKI